MCYNYLYLSFHMYIISIYRLMMPTGCFSVVLTPYISTSFHCVSPGISCDYWIGDSWTFRRPLVCTRYSSYFTVSFLLMAVFCIQTLALYSVVMVCIYRSSLGYIYYCYVYVYIYKYILESIVALCRWLSGPR